MIVRQPYRRIPVSRQVNFCYEIRTIFDSARQLQGRLTTIVRLLMFTPLTDLSILPYEGRMGLPRMAAARSSKNKHLLRYEYN